MDLAQLLKLKDEQIVDAKKNLGNVEIMELLVEKAKILHKMGKVEETIKIYEEAFPISVSLGKKLDIVFEIMLIYVNMSNIEKLKPTIERAKKLLEEGGDWEHRNRLKVYEGIYFMQVRSFSEAAKLFIDSVATFTSTEIFEFKDLVFYTILMAMATLDRITISKKIIHNSEILTTIRDIPYLKQFSDSLYYCEYAKFFEAFAHIIELLKKDRFLGQHMNYYVKEMRIVAYNQFLESYKSVTMDNMAESFGISVEMLDKELSRFIASGRINCKIDKVANIIESNRPDLRISEFQRTIKEGDSLINLIQKLSKALDI